METFFDGRKWEQWKHIKDYEKRISELKMSQEKTVKLLDETSEKYGTLILSRKKFETISESETFYSEKFRLEQSLFALTNELSRFTFEGFILNIEHMTYLAEQYDSMP